MYIKKEFGKWNFRYRVSKCLLGNQEYVRNRKPCGLSVLHHFFNKNVISSAQFRNSESHLQGKDAGLLFPKLYRNGLINEIDFGHPGDHLGDVWNFRHVHKSYCDPGADQYIKKEFGKWNFRYRVSKCLLDFINLIEGYLCKNENEIYFSLFLLTARKGSDIFITQRDKYISIVGGSIWKRTRWKFGSAVGFSVFWVCWSKGSKK